MDTTRVSFLLRLRDREDKVTWQDFHDRYGQLLYRYARARGASDADAEDVVQEVEMYLFKALDGFQYDACKGRFRAYLRASVVHAMGRRASRERRQPTALDPHDFDVLRHEEEARGDDRWEREWQLNRLRWGLRSIAGDFEATTLKAFELHVLAGQPVEHTAELLGLSKASVYQAKSRVLRRLRDHLATTDPDGDL
jgi:RNA polymerase sigma-70 factor (ECF subfamily)